jgi:putative hemolysin
MLSLEIAIVVVLICVNGLLAMSELAVVSSRPGKLKAMIERGVGGAAKALTLGANPGRFLSTVQIGITLVGVLSGAFSGATLGLRLTTWLQETGVPPGAASTLGVGIVVAAITYGSLIVGELVPKQIALRNPEAVASRVAPFMVVLATVAAPIVWFLDISGRLLLRLLGQTNEDGEKITDDEIKLLIAEAEQHGTIESDERQMIAGVMRLSDRQIRAVMTPRTDIDWLSLSWDEVQIRKAISESGHSRMPVAETTVDTMIGVLQTRELLETMLDGKQLDLRALIRPAPVVHDQANALNVLSVLREADVAVALVHDEYGHFEGIVTPADILEAIAGVFRSDLEPQDEPHAVERADGSWLLAGYMPADEMRDLLGVPLPENRDYETVAGFVLSLMHHLPSTGEFIDAEGWRFEVVDLDGRRIDKVLATRQKGTRRKLGVKK